MNFVTKPITTKACKDKIWEHEIAMANYITHLEQELEPKCQDVVSNKAHPTKQEAIVDPIFTSQDLDKHPNDQTPKPNSNKTQANTLSTETVDSSKEKFEMIYSESSQPTSLSQFP